MDSSFLLYREYMQSYAIGKVLQYEDIKYSKCPATKYEYEFYIWSLKRWVCNEIVAHITASQEDSVCKIIEQFSRDLRHWADMSTNLKNKLYFSIAAREADQIIEIFQ